MIKMNFHFRFLVVFFALILGFSSVYAFTTNQGGDFTLTFDTQKAVVVNTDIQTTFSMEVTNNLEVSEDIEFNFDSISGWNVITDYEEFTLEPGEKKEVNFTLKANSNFDYSENVVSSDTIKIGKNDEYRGFFEFPITLESSDDEVSVVFQVEVLPEEELDLSYKPRISSQKISPISPLSFTVEANNISGEHNVLISSKLGEYRFNTIETTFNGENNYKVFTIPIKQRISPGTYDTKVTIREESITEDSAQEWFTTKSVEVIPYKNIQVEEEDEYTLLIESKKLTLSNQGNVEDMYEKSINHSFFKGFFFTSKLEVENTNEGVILTVPLEKGEVKQVSYSYNYIGLYVFLLVILFLLGYFYYRKTSNPFDVETKIYDVKRDPHEGVKSLKVRIGFENMKLHEIETLKVTFKMPAYLSVNEDSFLLSPPNNVYKGKTQYKLEWNFKKFEKNDSRILGFQLLNSKGILGDIRFSDLEFEVKVNGKIKKHYTSLPIIKG